MPVDQRVFVLLKRPPGYDDVHAELVVEDAMRQDFPWELVRDEGAGVLVVIDRAEGYEDCPPIEVARDAIKDSWPPTWELAQKPFSPKPT